MERAPEKSSPIPLKKEKRPKGSKKKLDTLRGVEPKSERRAGTGAAALLVFLLMMLVFAGSLAAVYFNIGGVKDKVLLVLQEGESPYQNQYDEIDQQIRRLDARDSDLRNLESQLETRRTDLENKDRELAALEQTLLQRQDELIARAEELDATEKDLDLLVTMLEKMSATDAAKILGNSDVARITRVLRKMKQAKASEILAKMDTMLASQVAIAMMGQ